MGSGRPSFIQEFKRYFGRSLEGGGFVCPSSSQYLDYPAARSWELHRIDRPGMPSLLIVPISRSTRWYGEFTLDLVLDGVGRRLSFLLDTTQREEVRNLYVKVLASLPEDQHDLVADELEYITDPVFETWFLYSQGRDIGEWADLVLPWLPGLFERHGLTSSQRQEIEQEWRR